MVGCRSRLAEKYSLPHAEVQDALSHAESEDMADLFCFTHALTAAGMKLVMRQAMDHNYNRDKLYRRSGAFVQTLALAFLVEADEMYRLPFSCPSFTEQKTFHQIPERQYPADHLCNTRSNTFLVKFGKVLMLAK